MKSISLFLSPTPRCQCWQTDKQGILQGVLDYCEGSVRAPCCPPHPRTVGFLLFQQQALSLAPKLEVVPLTNFLWHGNGTNHM